MIDQGKDKKMANKRKCTEREYHVQDYEHFAHKYIRIFCNINQFPSFPFGDTHTKLHGVRGLCEHYHMIFDPKLVHGTCEIVYIPCDCAECTSMLDKP